MKMQTASSPLNIRIFDILLYYVLLASIIIGVASCSDDDEAKPDTRAQFIGMYEVEDVSSYSGHIYEYDITISNGSNGDLNLSNFADLFNVPVKATVDGNKITIKPQSFTNPSSGNTIHVSGSGTLAGNTLTFTYTTTGYLDYTGTCKASKKQ